MTEPPTIDWNLLGRILISLVILAIAAGELLFPQTRNSEALAISLVTLVAGFWLHVLPGGGKNP